MKSPGKGALLAALAAIGLAASAPAAAPPAERIANAIANSNRAAGRTLALSLPVELRRGEGAARGTLRSEPDGSVRLEIEAPGGGVERHLLRGSVLRAVRDGQPLADPAPFLPPFPLLQADSGAALQMRLIDLGGRGDDVALGYEGEHDCWVLGGREPGGPPRAAVWVDQESLEVVRIDRGDGASFRLGPLAAFGGVRVPAWIEVQAPGEPPARLVVLGASPVAPDPGAFAPSWLTGPAAKP